MKATILTVLVLAGRVVAQDITKCGGTTYDMVECASTIYRQSDAELNAAYRAALAALKRWEPSHSENLRAAERRWIAYRDAQCKAELDLFERGSGGPLARLACLIDLTDQRKIEINNTYLSSQ